MLISCARPRSGCRADWAAARSWCWPVTAPACCDICNRAIVLDRGRLMHAGDITESLKYYHELLAQLRAGKEPEAEPIPVGTAQIYGAVESLEMKEGGCVVRGWFVDTQGAVPAAVVLRVNGASYGTDDLERTSRPDVQRHFGLAEPTCGFI